MSSNLPWWNRSSSIAARLRATPSMRRAPIASTRACSTDATAPRACGPPGIRRRCTAGLWHASRSAIESAWPRTIAASRAVSLRGGSGSRALPAASPGRSAANPTSSSGRLAIARRQPATARLNGSVGASRDGILPLELELMAAALPRESRSGQRDVDRGFGELGVEAALVELGDDRPLELVALVEKGDAERKTEVVEDVGIFRPGDHGSRAHHRGDVAVHERVAREIRDAHHLADGVAPLGRSIRARLGEHDVDLVVMRQIVERRHDRPAVHLPLIDLLRA